MKNIETDKPDLVIGTLQIWIHGRQFPNSSDYWDINWLNSTARYTTTGSFVEVSGHIIHLSQIDFFLKTSEKALAGLVQIIELPTIEPNLHIKCELDKLGHMKNKITITPNQMSEKHEYIQYMDQSYIPSFISQCKAIFAEFPIKGDPHTK